MKHKHAEMIKAKVDNMELVVFEKQNTATHEKEEYKPIHPDRNRAIWFHEGADYFLCLPQHEEAVLNSLNGGVAQFESPREKGDHALEQADWSNLEWYMQSDATSRIKPKKEKRWIGVYGKHVTENHFDSKSEVEKHVNGSPVYSNCALEWWQFIEVEVEV